MPIIGADLPQKLIDDTRRWLLYGILTSSHLKTVFGENTKFELRRKTYTGDYSVWGKDARGNFKIASFGMLPLPGCKGIVVFHHASVEPEFRGKKLGRELLRIRTDVAIKVGYSVAQATVREDNITERGLLGSEGWMYRMRFKNYRTGNVIYMLQKSLRDDGYIGD